MAISAYSCSRPNFSLLKKTAGGLSGMFTGSQFTRQRYLDTVRMTYDLLNKARRERLMALETDVEDPEKSPIFSKHPQFLKGQPPTAPMPTAG